MRSLFIRREREFLSISAAGIYARRGGFVLYTVKVETEVAVDVSSKLSLDGF